jgi:hypothetical protein
MLLKRQCLSSSVWPWKSLEDAAVDCEDDTRDVVSKSPGKPMMESNSNRDGDDLSARLAGICSALDARAAGYWRFDEGSGHLIQLCFVAGAGLDPEVGRQFAAATKCVSVSQTTLGIVAAAITGRPAVSRVSELPAESGSGRWLRAFGASRSVAVPLRDAFGSVIGVLSIALALDNPLDEQCAVKTILIFAQATSDRQALAFDP